MKKLLLSVFFCSIFIHLKAQNQVGIFENHLDIGPVINKGSAIYDNASKVYTLTGSGENIWFKKDELHFAYKKIKGDFMLRTDLHRKSGWMARTGTDTSAAMVCLTVHGDGLTAFQYRKKNGMNIEEIKIPITGGDILQLERRGRSYFISVSKINAPFWTVEVPDFDFPVELLVGLFICSHNKNVVETGTFTNTRIFTAVK
jgi:TolB protein